MKRSNHWGPDSLIADPHLAKNFEQLSLRVKCGNIIEFHQKLVRNLLSFYDADDLTKTPRGSFGRGGCTNQTGSKPKDVLDEFENRMPKRFAVTQVVSASCSQIVSLSCSQIRPRRLSVWIQHNRNRVYIQRPMVNGGRNLQLYIHIYIYI